MALPPDLRLLTTQLAALSPPQLLPLLPVLTGHVLRCREPLLRPIGPKTARNSDAEASSLVQRLRTSITTLLTGRTAEGRLVGAALAKTVVDVGGWESLRASEPWVRGLLTGIQRPDPPAVKEVCLITITKIFVLSQNYPTLVREIVTPALPAFLTALVPHLSMTPPIAKNQKTTPLPPPASLITLATEAIATLAPLYSTTVRPFCAQIRTALKTYLAPTSTATPVPVPSTLRCAARRAVVILHHVAPKAGGSDDWAALVRTWLNDCHTTADQVLRPVDEAWRSRYGHMRARVDFDKTPCGGGANPDDLPPWEGTWAGAERLTGLLGCLAATLAHPTKTAVMIPVGALIDLTTRLSLIARYSPRSQTWDQALPTNAAAQREEKDQLWASIPHIHAAVLELLHVLVKRLRANIYPVVDDIFEAVVRIFRSGIESRELRTVAYELVDTLLVVAGPGLQKQTAASFEMIILTCCRDAQHAAGVAPPPPPQPLQPPQPTQPQFQQSKKKKPLAPVANADAFLAPPTTDTSSTPPPPLSPRHRAASESLVASMLGQIPTALIKPEARVLLDETAVWARSREALLASILAPYRTPSGKIYANVMPFLSGMFPQDRAMEVLRSTLRADAGEGAMWSEVEVLREEEEEDRVGTDGQDEDVVVVDAEPVDATTNTTPAQASTLFSATKIDTTTSTINPFAPASPSALKRQSSDISDPRPAKRHQEEKRQEESTKHQSAKHQKVGNQDIEEDEDDLAAMQRSLERELGIAVADRTVANIVKRAADARGEGEGGGDESEGESVHLEMEFDEEDEEEDEEDDEEEE